MAHKRDATSCLLSGVAAAVVSSTMRRITVTAVMIGVDPHKGSHTATALDATDHEPSRRKVRAGRWQVEQLLAWATPFEARTWAIESASGLG